MKARLKTIGIAFIVAATGIFVLGAIRLLGGYPNEEQNRVPGTIKVNLEPGRYYLWGNHWTRFDGKRLNYDADCPANAPIAIHDHTGKALGFDEVPQA